MALAERRIRYFLPGRLTPVVSVEKLSVPTQLMLAKELGSPMPGMVPRLGAPSWGSLPGSGYQQGLGKDLDLE